MSSLAVKYRPKKWDEVLGQDSIVKILSQQLINHDFKNTYIFSGATGCGKTTTARIFANEINNFVGEPIEIDAASNNSVDNIRNIVSLATERSLAGDYKIFILDEAHMLSTQAWNAFLKCIEEPPKYTIFIFCTTDPQKIPDTIKNRCMRFNFTRIPIDLINKKLQLVCKEEGFVDKDSVCDYISRICNGEMRNALSMLEMCADYSNELTIENAVNALGNFSYDTFFNLINKVIDCDKVSTIDIINSIYNLGSDLNLFVKSFLEFILDVNKYLLTNDISITKIPKVLEKTLSYSIKFEGATKYYSYYIDNLLQLKNMLKNDNDPKSTIEVIFLKMCELK